LVVYQLDALQVAGTMSTSSSYMGFLRVLWIEIMRQIRWHWENLIPIPNVDPYLYRQSPTREKVRSSSIQGSQRGSTIGIDLSYNIVSKESKENGWEGRTRDWLYLITLFDIPSSYTKSWRWSIVVFTKAPRTANHHRQRLVKTSPPFLMQCTKQNQQAAHRQNWIPQSQSLQRYIYRERIGSDHLLASSIG
jgi:hypothetical protein